VSAQQKAVLDFFALLQKDSSAAKKQILYREDIGGGQKLTVIAIETVLGGKAHPCAFTNGGQSRERCVLEHHNGKI